jgi:photosystem II stability/assembly factor-like uncharacterized protein
MVMRSPLSPVRALFCLFFGFSLLFVTPAARAQSSDDGSAFAAMQWRALGPANMGGRVTDIAGVPGDPDVFFVAGADGGVFKTTNGGVTFEALFTDRDAYSVGALGIAPSNPEVIWLGSGEGDPRNSVGYGRGVSRSTDGGKTWAKLGLENTERIKRIRVHPKDPDVAWVCALGHEWGPNEERGVFKTSDGGATWRKVLYVDEDTGCSDLDLEWANPKILYAGMWTFRRRPWRFDDGGKETALYRSLDGGETWTKLTGPGMPKGPMARIGVAVAQSRPSTVYMITETPDEGTLFRSDDRGETWRMVNDDRNINFRPFYYSDIRVDPNDPDVLYSLSGRLVKSTDGGKTFERIARDVHGDHQSFWIDPMNSDRLLSGSDGGFQVSYDAGETWDIINNVELSQFYQLYVDDRDPYYVCGGLQDNGTWCGPSNSLRTAGILKRDWYGIAYGDGYYAVPIPGDERYAYANSQGGVIYFVDTKTGNQRVIHPYPKITGSAGDAIAEHKYRFNWDSPILISPHDPEKVYFGGNVVFRTRDRGHTWEVLSGDLTENDKTKQASSGGEIYQDNTAAEFYNTILTIAESPVEEGVLWVGTDDGHVWLSRDDGAHWEDVTKNIEGFPRFGWVGKIHASEHDAGTAFVAVDHHRMDDFRPYAFMTTDFGRTWTNLSPGMPQDDYVKVVRQDPRNPDLLYAGMEHGIIASWDRGKTWRSIRNNLPPVSVRDLRVQARAGDLIVGTHGRGAWVLDDIRPLQEWDAVRGERVHLFDVRPATKWKMHSRLESLGQRTYRAKNPDYGVYVNFGLAEAPDDPVTLTITDADGRTVRVLTDSTAKAGLNRIVWDLREEGPTPLASGGGGGFRGSFRPSAMPGRYTATLEALGETHTAVVEVRADPRLDATMDDYRAAHDAVAALTELLSETHGMINDADALVRQLKELKGRLAHLEGDRPPTEGAAELPAPPDLASAIDEAVAAITAFRDDVLTRPPPNMGYRQRPRLREEIRSLAWAVDGAFARPTEPQMKRLVELTAETETARETFRQLLETHVAPINEMAKSVPQVVIGSDKP